MPMTLDEFLGHTTNAPKSAYLSRWRKRPPPAGKTKPSVRVILHQHVGFEVLWRHQWKRMFEIDGKMDVNFANLVCHEEERVIKAQHRRLDDDSRSLPPQKCGMCKMIEWVRQRINDEEMAITEPLFRYVSDVNPSHNATLRAGGITGLFGGDKLTDDEQLEMRKHGIFKKEAFKEKALAQANYAFVVVEYDAPAEGVQIAVESALLGDKMKTAIFDRISSLGREEGDPLVNPVVFEWEYDPADGIEFQKKYAAGVIQKLALTDQMKMLIDGEAPTEQLERLRRKFNPLQLRAELEEHALVKLPWDEFFGPVAAGESEGNDEAEEAEERRAFEAGLPDREVGEVSSHHPSPSSDGAVAIPADAGEDEIVACDSCGKDILITDKKCKHCGHVYEAEPMPVPTPEPPKRLTRSELAAQKSAAAAAERASKEQAAPKAFGGAPQEKAAPKKPSAFEDIPADDNDVPF